MKISLIVPVAQASATLGPCLRSLRTLRPPPAELIVVFDGPDEAAARLANAAGARVLHLDQRGGPARARNRGARAAAGDLLLFLDADVTAPSHLLGRLAAVFRQEPALAAVIGSYDDRPAAPNFLSQYKNLLHHYAHQHGRAEASTFWGACGAIRRNVFLAADGFDERYLNPSVEDIELGYRLRRAGHVIRLDKTLQVRHLKRWTARSLLHTDFFRRALPWAALSLRHRQLLNDLNLDRRSRASVALLYSGLACLFAAAFWPPLLSAALLLLAALLALNAPLYAFFWRRRGLRFALQAIPWHWLYYGYSALAFALALANHTLGRSHSWPIAPPNPTSR